MLARRHNTVVDFEITVPELLLKQEQRTKTIFNIVLGAIASISLIVGGIGIMNIMLASVLERIREIGVRRAMGATQKDILFQFLSEAVLISVAGGVAGILVGAGLSFGIERFADIKTIVSLPLGLRRLRRVVHRGPRLRHRARVSRGASGSGRLSAVRVKPFTVYRLALGAWSLALPSAFCLLPSATAVAQQQQAALQTAQPVAPVITLQQAVEMAQKQGFQATAATATRDAARANESAFRARRLPQLSLTGNLPQFRKDISAVPQPDGTAIFRPCRPRRRTPASPSRSSFPSPAARSP